MISQYQDSQNLLIKERTFQLGPMDSTYEDVLENIDSGIMLFDEEGMVSYVNKHMYNMLELNRHSLVGCTLSHLLSHVKLSRFKKKQVLQGYRELIFKGNSKHEFIDE